MRIYFNIGMVVLGCFFSYTSLRDKSWGWLIINLLIAGFYRGWLLTILKTL